MDKKSIFLWLTVMVAVGACQTKGDERPSSDILSDYKWAVEQIDGRAINANSRVTLLFSSDGLVAGRASCNRLNGRYEASGESLMFDDLATTRMACPEPLMVQEKRFLETLRLVKRYAISQHGALLLYSGEKVVVEALPEES